MHDRRAKWRADARLRKLNRAARETAPSGPLVSPLAPPRFPDLPVVAGVRFATTQAGVRYKGRQDVMLVELAPGTAIAGVFTTSATRSGAVLDCQQKLADASAPESGAAILVNSGNANAFTGGRGAASVSAICDGVADTLGLPVSRVFTSSTGVIGEPLPHEKITAALNTLCQSLRPDGIAAAAQAIMTTDTFPKGAQARFDLGGKAVHIAGIAKGSGMIAPDMATMLVYIFTDAAIAPEVLQEILSNLNTRTFNAITVDSDTSTSDTLLLAATGHAGNSKIEDAESSDAKVSADALHTVMQDLALQVVRDGEGATKLVEVRVTGAVSVADARRVALSIANSPLVKTAIAGEDPNWGRIVMAVGKSGAAADRDKLHICFGDILVAENGEVAASYREQDGASYMQREEIVIRVDLGLGAGDDRVWTCDLTKRYIEINADYRS
jgi:glutamate N-acetyltransferase/amino-acid N-acetyltransferase